MTEVSQPSNTDQETASLAQAPKRLRLLLIQHDPRVLITLWDKFKNAGFEVDLAPTAHLAVDKFRTAIPDAIFIDLAPATAKALGIIKEARRSKVFGTRPIYVCATGDYLATAKRGATAATKVFDKADTSLDAIVTDLAKTATQCRDEAAAQAESKPVQKAKQNGSLRFSLNPFNLLQRKRKQPPRAVPASAGEAPVQTADSPISNAPPQASPPLVVPASAVEQSAELEHRNHTPPSVPESKIDNSPAPTRSPTHLHPGPRPVVGVFTVDADGKIMSADGAAAKMFGWNTAALVGEELKVLLKHGCESELDKIVQQAGNSSNQLISVRVTALTKGGAEFPASITRLAWSTDTVHLPRSAHVPFTWTAVFRDLSSAAAGGSPGNTSFLPREMKELAESRETQAILRGANQSLQKQLDVMTARVGLSQEAAEKAQKQRDQLTARLEALENEAARARAALDHQTEAHQSNDSQLRHLSTEKFQLAQQIAEHSRTKQQLERVATEVSEAKAAAKEDAARARALQEEIDELRQTHDELKTRPAAAESKEQADQTAARLRETTAELDRLGAERTQLESALREAADELGRIKAERAKGSQEAAGASEAQAQLVAAKAALETAEQRIKSLEHERLDIGDRSVAEKQAAEDAKRRQQELEAQLQEALQALQQLKAQRDEQVQGSAPTSALQAQLAAIKADAEEKETALRESNARAKRLERDAANLRDERHELHAKCVAEKQAGTKSKRRITELEKQLRDIASAFAIAKQELEKRAAGGGPLQTNLQGDLGAAKAAQDEQTVRANLLERELGQVCEARDELRAQVEAEQQKLLVASQHVEDLEARVRESVAELARAKAAAENHAAIVESRPPPFQNADDLIKDLHRLRENEAAHKAEMAELERRLRDSVASLTGVSADLQTERSERRRLEQRLSALNTQLAQTSSDLNQHLESARAGQSRVTDLEQQVREHERTLARARADLQNESGNREVAEQQLQAVGDMGAQLRQYLSLFEESKKVFQRAHEQLEVKLRATQDALTEIQKELSERRDLEASQHGMNGRLRDSVEGLISATRRLLEITSDVEQKKLAQSVLERALLLQSTLGETSASSSGADLELRSAA